jgi:hypothetical protein
MYHEELSFEKRQSEREGNYHEELVWILMKKLGQLHRGMKRKTDGAEEN